MVKTGFSYAALQLSNLCSPLKQQGWEEKWKRERTVTHVEPLHILRLNSTAQTQSDMWILFREVYDFIQSLCCSSPHTGCWARQRRGWRDVRTAWAMTQPWRTFFTDLVRNSSTKKHYIIYSPELSVFKETIYFTLQDLAFSFDRQWSSDCNLVQMDTA